MGATEELRRMLDGRGVEYFKHEDGEPLRKLEKADEPATSWSMGGASVCAVPIEGSGLFDLWIDHCTPEQAIAATLGSGTCPFARPTDLTDGCAALERIAELEELGGGECEVVSSRFDDMMSEWCIELSCGHAVWDRTEPPNYCSECGAKVRKAAGR